MSTQSRISTFLNISSTSNKAFHIIIKLIFVLLRNIYKIWIYRFKNIFSIDRKYRLIYISLSFIRPNILRFNIISNVFKYLFCFKDSLLSTKLIRISYLLNRTNIVSKFCNLSKVKNMSHIVKNKLFFSTNFLSISLFIFNSKLQIFFANSGKIIAHIVKTNRSTICLTNSL